MSRAKGSTNLRYSPRLRHATSDARILAAGVGEAAERLAIRLRHEQRAALRLRLLVVFADDGRVVAGDQQFDRPTAEEPQLYRAGRGLLARLLAQPREVERLTLILDRLAAASPILPLFDSAGVAPGVTVRRRDETLLDRVAALRAKIAAKSGVA